MNFFFLTFSEKCKENDLHRTACFTGVLLKTYLLSISTDRTKLMHPLQFALIRVNFQFFFNFLNKNKIWVFIYLFFTFIHKYFDFPTCAIWREVNMFIFSFGVAVHPFVCRLFQPPKLKTEGGDAFLVGKLHIFKVVYSRLKMG